MAISFNNIPSTVRTPNVFAEIDNSRALQGLAQNPHRALLIGTKIAAGTVAYDTLTAISRDNLADGFFGPGSVLARMCNVFKKINPNTELYAMAIGSGVGGTHARWSLGGLASYIDGVQLSADTGLGTLYLMVNGTQIPNLNFVSGWSAVDVASLVKTEVNKLSQLPVTASVGAGTGSLIFSAVNSGVPGNYIQIQFNYYEGQSWPAGFSARPSTILSITTAGATDPDLGDVWTVIDNEQFQYMATPFTDTANLVEIEDELENRFTALEDKWGHAFVGFRGVLTSCQNLGSARNCPHLTIAGAYNAPQAPEEWAAAWAAVASFNLNNDPARPLQFLKLPSILPPASTDRFTRTERDTLLYRGIATWIVDSGGDVCIERSITTYKANALGLPDWSYLDIQTPATLAEIRYQYRTRMSNRYIIPRFKLADDDYPVQAGTYVCRPKDIKSETIALFAMLQDIGLIENLDDFISNLVVERDLSDVNRVNVLLPCDLINQFRVLAAKIPFIL